MRPSACRVLANAPLGTESLAKKLDSVFVPDFAREPLTDRVTMIARNDEPTALAVQAIDKLQNPSELSCFLVSSATIAGPSGLSSCWWIKASSGQVCQRNSLGFAVTDPRQSAKGAFRTSVCTSDPEDETGRWFVVEELGPAA